MNTLSHGWSNRHAWLGRLGHFSRRGALALGAALLGLAGLVVYRATAAARDNLTFDPMPYEDAAGQLGRRAAAVERKLRILPADDLLARYVKPRPPPPPPVVAPVAGPPEPTAEERLHGWRMRGLLMQGGRPMAVLNQQIVGVGDRVDRFEVTAITERYTELRDPEGRLHRLDLYEGLPLPRNGAAAGVR